MKENAVEAWVLKWRNEYTYKAAAQILLLNSDLFLRIILASKYSFLSYIKLFIL